MEQGAYVIRNRALVPALMMIGWVAGCTDDPVAPGTPESPPEAPPLAAVMGGTTEYEPLPGETTAEAISFTARVEAGDVVVGTSGGRPVVWRGPGRPEELPVLPGSTGNRPHDAENEMVVGEATIAGEARMVVWNLESGTVTDEGIVLASGSPPLTLEPSGYAAGTTVDPTLGNRAFLWRLGQATLLEPLPGDDETEAQYVGWRGSVLGVSRTHGTNDGTIVIWHLGQPPVSTPFDEATYAPKGFQDFGSDHAKTLLSSHAGDRVLIWEEGVITEVPNPGASEGDLYGAVYWDAVNVLGWVQPDSDSERQYGLWTWEDSFFLFHPLTPGWECTRFQFLFNILCTADFRRYPFLVLADQSHPSVPDGVSDLRPTARTSTSITVTWTQIDDGTGHPADYRIKYNAPPIAWSTGIRGCSKVEGTEIGAPLSCIIIGLDPGEAYDFQLYSYRVEDGLWVDAFRSNVATAETAVAEGSTQVADLSVDGASSATLTVSWTQVDDGTGNPAWYRVKYGTPIVDWSDATVGCERTIRGDEIGAPISCTIEGLDAATAYEVQLMSYRLVDGFWRDARYSNLVTGSTEP